MKNRDFILCNVDTDSITICKNDMSHITPEENEEFMRELNALFPKTISWEDDGYYPIFCVLKAKNYILYDGKKVKLKGSSIKDQKKEPALQEMLNLMIDDIVFHDSANLQNIYHDYIREAKRPYNIERWSQKKTLTKALLDCKTNPDARANERIPWEAVKDKNLQEGDKFYTYPAILSKTQEITIQKNGKEKIKEIVTRGLHCPEDWNGDHDSMKLVERVVDTVKILYNVVDENLFLDYTLKKNVLLLEQL